MEMNLYKCSKCEIITHSAMCSNSRILDNGCLHNWGSYSSQVKEDENKAVIQFIQEEESKENKPTFGDVEVNQFFVNGAGYLCIKINDEDYCSIADANKIPYASIWRNIDSNKYIERIIPKIKKVEF